MLTVDQLSAGYGKLTILQQVDLRIALGQFVAILGPNGSGKSTLLKTIFGLTDRTAGTIDLAGQYLTYLPTEAIQRLGIAYVPQRHNVFAALTVRENLQLAARTLPATARTARLAELFRLFPILESRQRQRAGKLSGGERQMLAIALAWLAGPQLMLLDEPSAGLSPLMVTEVFKTLQQLKEQGLGLGVVEQNARSVLRFCDYVYVLREGRVAFQGAADELLANEEIVKNYLGVHTGK
ncbi:MAG: ABC transporter ATP-binding protein [Caldilineaceae bacterium]|nr:ABC transporter ATP-binding protein [Caldilineaceae bacterium]